MARMTGVIYSDLGVASSFMALEWVQSALCETLGYAPYPATLNVRPQGPGDAEIWRSQRAAFDGVPLRSAQSGFCDATLYPIRLAGRSNHDEEAIDAAILVPKVAGYPIDKIEIIAAVRLKDHLGVEDGDALTLEFLN